MKREAGDAEGATTDFRRAKLHFEDKSDRLRMDLHVAAIERAANRKKEAIEILRGARTVFAGIPEAAAATAWLTILDPPPPPPAAPR